VTFLTWRFYKSLRPLSVQSSNDLRVAERSLDNLFDAIRKTERPTRKVLIVLSPLEDELNGHERVLTKHVQAILLRSGFDVLDLHAAVSAAVIKDFYPDNMHLNVEGNQFYADQIAARLAPALSRAP
jgi:hypothetical protein